MAKSQKKFGPENPIERLLAAMGEIALPTNFSVSGNLLVVDIGLTIKDFGRVSIPLKRGGAKPLIARCQVAPYGKGTKTLVDTRVRNTFELDPQYFSLSDEWNKAIADAIPTVADSLGLPADRLEAKLYKLLVYEKGGFFLPHRDSEKLDRMVASLIVVLPNPFQRGSLIVRHGGNEKVFSFREASEGKNPCFAAFYADCEHEVCRVTGGVRIALAYNLVLKPLSQKSLPVTGQSSPADQLAQAIGTRVANQPTKPLVFALEHHYTQSGLSVDLLKGSDRQLADLVASAAAKADCLVYLSQVERHLSQEADGGDYDDYDDDYDDDDSEDGDYRNEAEFDLGDIYEDELNGTEWVDLDGNKQPWGAIEFDLSAIVSSVPIDQWKPTRQEYEGYSGNAGNTLDRWYRRSAIVVWHRHHHFDVISAEGAAKSVPSFCSMAKKLAKTPKKNLDSARLDAIRFARAIIARWSRRSNWSNYFNHSNETEFKDFVKHLPMLHDQDTVAAFLKTLATSDEKLSVKSLVLAACHEFGWPTFAPELKNLIAKKPKDQDNPSKISLLDFEWLAEICSDPSKDPNRLKLAGELCDLAATRFCQPRSNFPYYDDYENASIEKAKLNSLSSLLQSLAVTGRETNLAKVIRFVQGLPKEFSLAGIQIPCLKLVIPWSRERLKSVHPQFKSWLDAMAEKLELATAQKPKRPTDWVRSARITCHCRWCAQLKTFLADPATEVSQSQVTRQTRQHLTTILSQYPCDVRQMPELKGHPQNLVFQKTTGSYDLAVERFEQDRDLLKALRALAKR